VQAVSEQIAVEQDKRMSAYENGYPATRNRTPKPNNPSVLKQKLYHGMMLWCHKKCASATTVPLDSSHQKPAVISGCFFNGKKMAVS